MSFHSSSETRNTWELSFCRNRLRTAQWRNCRIFKRFLLDNQTDLDQRVLAKCTTFIVMSMLRYFVLFEHREWLSHGSSLDFGFEQDNLSSWCIYTYYISYSKTIRWLVTVIVRFLCMFSSTMGNVFDYDSKRENTQLTRFDAYEQYSVNIITRSCWYLCVWLNRLFIIVIYFLCVLNEYFLVIVLLLIEMQSIGHKVDNRNDISI